MIVARIIKFGLYIFIVFIIISCLTFCQVDPCFHRNQIFLLLPKNDCWVVESRLIKFWQYIGLGLWYWLNKIFSKLHKNVIKCFVIDWLSTSWLKCISHPFPSRGMVSGWSYSALYAVLHSYWWNICQKGIKIPGDQSQIPDGETFQLMVHSLA